MVRHVQMSVPSNRLQNLIKSVKSRHDLLIRPLSFHTLRLYSKYPSHHPLTSGTTISNWWCLQWKNIIHFPTDFVCHLGGSSALNQPMVNWCFGARWFGIRIGIPLRITIAFIFGDPIGIQTTGPQTICWLKKWSEKKTTYDIPLCRFFNKDL